ncbi:MAG: hypothetical protein J0M33_26020 [Anaerolineae bacterium]|nr:hypothetical protein [Anaerolineae bacterium]
MYAAPKSLKLLIKKYAKADALGSADDARTLIYIELIFHLAIRLGLGFEPLKVGWALLSRIPLHDVRLDNLSSEQRRMWANAAQIIPLSSSAVWQQTLVRYVQDVPAETRMYDIPTLERLDEITIGECRKPVLTHDHALREAEYETILSDVLPFEQRRRHETQVGKSYRVVIKAEGKVQFGRVRITKETQPQPVRQHWFDGPRPRTVIHLRLHELLPTAEYLDSVERQRGARIHWVDDLQKIRLRRSVIEDRQVVALTSDETADMNTGEGLLLEGMTHLPGMVSAGKTTLAKLIIAHSLLNDMDVRITFVVGDSQTAISTAHQINGWFFDDPAGEDVLAVQLMGASQRAVHWKRLAASNEYKQCVAEGRPHWGERWLIPVCLIEPHIRWEGDADVQIPLGSEPCEGFVDDSRTAKGKRRSRPESCVCPLTNICPSKQVYRDMPKARVWITTPGALSQASLPLYWDRRIVKIGELVYEQSDLVILDEVETIVDWFDKTYARTEALTNGKDGLLDKLDLQIAQFWLNNRRLTTDQRRWILAVRESLKALTGVLSAVDDPKQKREVRQWVSKGYFSPNQLAYRLARRLAGLKEWDDSSLPAEIKREHDQQANEAFKPFNDLLNNFVDPLRRTPDETPEATTALAGIMQAINNLADNVADIDIFGQCKAWITAWHPDIEARLAALKQKLEGSEFEPDHNYAFKLLDRSADDLARRLQFFLMVALLDRHIHIVTEEWHNKPETLDVAQPFSRIPRSMRSILPLPLTGRQYGFVFPTGRGKPDVDSANHLSLFAYTNIGRSYLLNFHRLLQDFDGQPGPHVLALSGTSYLPDSTTFHVDVVPKGILMPAEQVEQALEQSEFVWQPFNYKGKPIFISGRSNKENQLKQLTLAMLEHSARTGGFVGAILDRIESNARDERTRYLWADRSRVLVLTNSYKQAKKVAETLRDKWRYAAETIYELKRGTPEEDYEVEFVQPGKRELQRMDIEGFARTDGRILVAPAQSIGRGFNILNQDGRAAFGAVLFLTRPMNPPHDRAAMSQELNRLALEWAADETFTAWQHDTLYKKAKAAREAAEAARRLMEYRKGYIEMDDDAALGIYPRRDLAATSAGRVIQAVGRLVRGGVPFYAYFIDASWSPEFANSGNTAGIEPAETSLLTAMIDVLNEYAGTPIGEALYGGLSDVLHATINRDSN